MGRRKLRVWLAVGLLLATLAASSPRLAPTLAQNSDLAPGALAIYYGSPSFINDANGNIFSAAAVFGDYDAVVFIEGLEEPGHVEHRRTTEIIRILQKQYNTRVFGYIDAPKWGTTWTVTGGAPLDWSSHLDLWRQMGVDGIFVDRFGYDWRIDRSVQNQILDAVHAAGMSAFVNGWFIDHVFGSQPDSRYPWGNPAGAPSHINAGDLYLFESFAVMEDAFDACARVGVDSWIDKAEKSLAYKRAFGTQMWAIATAANTGAAPQNVVQKLDYVWHAAAMYGFEGVGWSEPYFSASGPLSNQLPWRQRPGPFGPAGLGSVYLGDPTHVGDVLTRRTDLGQFRLICNDGGTHQASFTFNSLPTATPSPTATVTPAPTDVPVPVPCQLALYDLNGDGLIDIEDITAVLYASVFFNRSYEPRYDFVTDGVIDIADISAVAARFGQRCP